jgi:hypothetical protein
LRELVGVEAMLAGVLVAGRGGTRVLGSGAGGNGHRRICEYYSTFVLFWQGNLENVSIIKAVGETEN